MSSINLSRRTNNKKAIKLNKIEEKITIKSISSDATRLSLRNKTIAKITAKSTTQFLTNFRYSTKPKFPTSLGLPKFS